MRQLLARIDPYIAALLGMVALSIVAPVHGAGAELLDALVNAMIVLLFFGLGVKLPRSTVISALSNWRLHGLILAITYALFPLIGLAAHAALLDLFTPGLWTGFLFLCALPSTVQSSVAFTSIARGNTAAAVTAAAGSNILGVALTPMLLSLLLSAQQSAFSVDLASVVRLAGLLLAPFLLGQVLAPYLGGFFGRAKKLLTLNDRGVILLAVYSAFSAATIERLWDKLPLTQLAIAIVMSILLLAIVMAASWRAGSLFRLALPDRIAILMCGSKKSLASGVPMAAVLFGSGSGLILIPIMIYHQVQLLVCAVIARKFSERSS